MTAREPPKPDIEIEIVRQLRTAIIKLRGEHDLSTQPRIREALTQASGQGRVLLDFSECTFADSSVIAAISLAREEMRDGRLEVVIPPEAAMIRRLAEVARLADIVPISSSLPDVTAGEV